MICNNKVITKNKSDYKVYTQLKNTNKKIVKVLCNYKISTFLLIYYIVITSPVLGFTLPNQMSDGRLFYGHLDQNETLFIENNYLNIGKNDKNLTQIQSDASGRFVLGIPQDLKILTLTLKKNGKTTKHSYPITPNKWREEVVSGLQPEKVSPSTQNSERIAREAAEIRLARQKSTYNTLPYNWIKPVQEKHRISSFFGSRRVLNGIKKQGHSGVDYAAPIGTPVVSPAPGKVVYINPDVFLTGKTVMVDHGFGLFSSYSHLNSISVSLNQTLNQGDQIGTVGTTGRSTGPHLHFTLTWFGVRVDPESVFDSSTHEKQIIYNKN